MKKFAGGLVAAVACVLMLSGAAQAEETVTLKGVHLCCGGCIKGVAKAVKKSGAKAECDKDAKTVTVIAADAETAQKALNGIAKAGYHGTSSSKTIKIKDDSGAKDGKVEKITLVNAHLCCGGCAKTVKKALDSVEGVKGNNVEAKAKEFVVEGEFEAKAVIAALNKAGFHVKLKKDKSKK